MAKHSAQEYTYRVFYSPEDEAYVATVYEFKSLSNIDNDQLAALSGIVDLVSSVLDDLEKSGEPIPAPLASKTYSGHISLRITPEQHRRLAMESAEQGVSINQLLVSRV